MRTAAELLACLEREVEIARRITGALDRQHRALQELDLAGLEVSTVELEKAGAALREADVVRAEAAGTLGAALGLPAEAPLREVLARVPAGAKERPALEAVWTTLKQLMEEMHHRNYANYILMVNAARYNRALMQFVSGTSTTYGGDGSAGETGAGRSVVLNKKA